MLGEYVKVDINPDIVPVQVNWEDYSSNDLNSYYSGTYLLLEVEEGYLPCVVERVTDAKNFRIGYYKHSVGGWEYVEASVEPRKLFRFVPPSGFYIVRKTGKLMSFTFSNDRSYKKGLKMNNVSAFTLNENSQPASRPPVLRILKDIVYPTHISKRSRVITRKLAINFGKLIISHKNYIVGRVSGDVITTPYECIQDRVMENYEVTRGLTCQVQEA